MPLSRLEIVTIRRPVSAARSVRDVQQQPRQQQALVRKGEISE